jgi:hypothetical protein
MKELDYAQVMEQIEAGDLAALARHDQLNVERANGRAFEGFKEGDVAGFMPTFKLQPGTDLYEQRPGKKRREPAWTDRILWRSAFDRQEGHEGGGAADGDRATGSACDDVGACDAADAAGAADAANDDARGKGTGDSDACASTVSDSSPAEGDCAEHDCAPSRKVVLNRYGTSSSAATIGLSDHKPVSAALTVPIRVPKR